MPDWLTPEQRSRNMSAIRSSATGPERVLAAILSETFPRRRIRSGRDLPGHPDFVLPALHLTVFADGCYWHGCQQHGRTPDDNATYWGPKLARNKRRDRAVTADLRAAGYCVVRVWEHDLRKPAPTLPTRLRRAGTRSLNRRKIRPSRPR